MRYESFDPYTGPAKCCIQLSVIIVGSNYVISLYCVALSKIDRIRV